jgi:hypothetical protein
MNLFGLKLVWFRFYIILRECRTLKILLMVTGLLVMVSGCGTGTTISLPATPGNSSGDVTSYLYYYLTTREGRPVYTIVYSLANSKPEPLTVNRVEVLDGVGDVKHSVSEPSIQESSTGGFIETGKSIKLAVQVSSLPDDIKEWTVRWYCTDSVGRPITIEGGYSIPHN